MRPHRSRPTVCRHLLPRARSYPPLYGAAVAALALIAAGAILIRAEMVLAEAILFYTFAGLAVAFGTLMITQRNPVHAALSFAMVVLSTCGLFLLLAAPFLMAATIIVYAGAIVVTFLFVIMLAQQAGMTSADQRSPPGGGAASWPSARARARDRRRSAVRQLLSTDDRT